MNEIWANRLIAGTQTWDRCVKSGRSEAVKAILAEAVVGGKITPEEYKRITGDPFEAGKEG